MTRVPPRMDLPASAMPWGRWMSDGIQSARDSLGAESANADSVGAQFRSQADGIAQTIQQFATRSMVLLDVPSVVGSSSGAGWVSVGRDINFNVNANVRPEILGTLVMSMPDTVGTLYPRFTRILVNGMLSTNDQNTIVTSGPFFYVPPGVNHSVSNFSLSGIVSPGTVNTIRIEFGVYNDWLPSQTVQVNVFDITLALIFEEA